jgi:hydroxymethylpyrimidine/phosphomethylpyrimidine kinase
LPQQSARLARGSGAAEPGTRQPGIDRDGRVSTVLVIAGADSSGGAGITRDVRTLTQLGAQALCVVTAVTAQSDTQLCATHIIPAELVRAQMAAALATCHPGAIKIGMLATAATVLAVEAALPAAALPVVLDPVLASSSGGELLDSGGRAALCTRLLPRVTLLTPNIPEAATLIGTGAARSEAELLEQAAVLLSFGPQAVLIKGGHGGGPEACDLLLMAQQAPRWLRAPRSRMACRGTGCALSSAIAAGLAAGVPLATACERAKQYVTQLLLEEA